MSIPYIFQAQALPHAHNDYNRNMPFHSASAFEINSIEVDIFMVDNKLYVAHDKEDIQQHRSFKNMYIHPIKANIDSISSLQLLIDIKSYSKELLIVLKYELEEIIEHITSKDQSFKNKITIVLSGDLDKNEIVNEHYPLFYLDGRPSDLNKKQTLQHCKLISDNFKNYCHYKGLGKPPKKEIEALKEIIRKVHDVKMPIRFWDSSNHINVWRLLDMVNVDFISIDDYKNFNNYREKKALDFGNNHLTLYNIKH